MKVFSLRQTGFQGLQGGFEILEGERDIPEGMVTDPHDIRDRTDLGEGDAGPETALEKSSAFHRLYVSAFPAQTVVECLQRMAAAGR